MGPCFECGLQRCYNGFTRIPNWRPYQGTMGSPMEEYLGKGCIAFDGLGKIEVWIEVAYCQHPRTAICRILIVNYSYSTAGLLRVGAVAKIEAFLRVLPFLLQQACWQMLSVASSCSSIVLRTWLGCTWFHKDSLEKRHLGLYFFSRRAIASATRPGGIGARSTS